jgi:hypothetical protein
MLGTFKAMGEQVCVDADKVKKSNSVTAELLKLPTRRTTRRK